MDQEQKQASTFGWERYVGPVGRVVGMNTFGASAPLSELQKEFGDSTRIMWPQLQEDCWRVRV